MLQWYYSAVDKATKWLSGWRTKVVALATFFVGLLEAVQPTIWVELIGPGQRATILAVLAILTYTFRHLAKEKK